MDSQVEIVWRPTERQSAAMAAPQPDLFFGGARGGGKSAFLLADWIAMADRHPGCTGLLVRRTLPELDDIKRAALALYTQLGATYREQAGEWTMPSGSVLRLRYLESLKDASRYQGHAYQWLGVDEAGNYEKPDVIDLLRGCLRSTKGFPTYLRLTGNPGGPGHDWLKARYILPAKPGTPFTDPETGIRRIFVPSMLSDNPHITDVEAYKRNLRAAGPPHLVQAWLHGDWNILPNGGILDPSKVNRAAPPDHLKSVYLTIDGAFSAERLQRGDDSALTIYAIEGTKPARHWIMFQEARRMSITELADRTLELCREWDPQQVLIEGGPNGLSLEAVLVERFDDAGVWWAYTLVSNAGDKGTKAAPLAAILGAGRLWVPEGAAFWPALRDQMTSFDGLGKQKDDRIDSAGIAPRQMRLESNEPPEHTVEYQPLPRTRAAMGLPEKVGEYKQAARPNHGGLARRSAFRR